MGWNDLVNSFVFKNCCVRCLSSWPMYFNLFSVCLFHSVSCFYFIFCFRIGVARRRGSACLGGGFLSWMLCSLTGVVCCGVSVHLWLLSTLLRSASPLFWIGNVYVCCLGVCFVFDLLWCFHVLNKVDTFIDCDLFYPIYVWYLTWP